MKQTKAHISEDDPSLFMKAALGATVVSLVTSFSTHHVMSQPAHSQSSEIVSAIEVGHLFEREREILHAHSSLSRSRYATVSGTSA